MARPSSQTKDAVDAICSRMAEGESLRSICRSKDMPALGTVFRWLAKDPVFREQYEMAMVQRADAVFEDLIEIADTASLDDTPRARLMVDARKWAISKLAPKKYGDKIDVENKHSGGINFTWES